jgi:hypothetical protein
LLRCFRYVKGNTFLNKKNFFKYFFQLTKKDASITSTLSLKLNLSTMKTMSYNNTKKYAKALQLVQNLYDE